MLFLIKLQASWNLLETGVATSNLFGEFNNETVTEYSNDFTVALFGMKLESVKDGAFFGITKRLERPSASSKTL